MVAQALERLLGLAQRLRRGLLRVRRLERIQLHHRPAGMRLALSIQADSGIKQRVADSGRAAVARSRLRKLGNSTSCPPWAVNRLRAGERRLRA